MTYILPEITPGQRKAMNDALKATVSDFDLNHVLQNLAETAATMVKAQYAALGVPDEHSGLAQFLTYGMTEGQVSAMDHLPYGNGLLGALLASPEVIRLEHMQHDSRSAGFCAHHPRMTSFLGVPILASGRHLGVLYLCDRLDGQPFTDADEYMISTLAAFAAIAILNAQHYEQQRKLSVFEDRDRIAMELHDGIIQSIYAVGMSLEIARTALDKKSDLNDVISRATNDLDQVIDDLRSYIRDLKVGLDYSLELQRQLEEIARQFRSTSSATLALESPKAFALLTEERLHAIVQTVRESMSNIVRHAQASAVHLRLQESATHITLTISDNGIGFEQDAVNLGRGLINMRRRIERLNGTLEIVSQPHEGTTLTFTL